VNLSLSDVLLIMSVILPVLVPLGAALFKHLVDALPSNQRQAVVDAVRIATHAVSVDPSIAADAESAALAMLKELHLPASPSFVKSLVTIFQQDLASSEFSQGLDQGVSQSEVHPPVGFAPPPPLPAASPAMPNLHR
jgi:hypothetical protein